jgi:LysM repeat protein
MASRLAGDLQGRARILRYLAPLVLLACGGAVAILVLSSPVSLHSQTTNARLVHARVRHVPPYWIVHPNDTLAHISSKTGLSIAALEAYNPNANPNALIPGERLNLWRHPPKPRPKPPGPMFYIVKPGDSLGSIAAATQINMVKLEHLNPKLVSGTLQPGERLILRR